MSSENHERRLDALILDLVEWLVTHPRPYSEVMDAWRTSCARLPIWEEAVDRGLVVSEMVSPGGVYVTVTPAGREFLKCVGATRQARALPTLPAIPPRQPLRLAESDGRGPQESKNT